MVTTRMVVSDGLRPNPPRAGGRNKYARTQRFRHQYAKIVVTLSSVSKIVVRANRRLKMAMSDRLALCAFARELNQIFDSSTCPLIHRVSSAGRTPIKN